MAEKQNPERYSAGYLNDLDGRLSVAQDMRDRFRSFTDDLGGVDDLSYAQRSLVERALWLEYWLSEQEKSLARGNDFDAGKWVQAVNSFQGILTKLGLHRRFKCSPDLSFIFE